jgi:hypothetical protein
LRVAHLTSDHTALDSRIFHKECRSLARAGHLVTVVGPHERDEEIDGVKIKAIGRASSRWSLLTVTLWQVCREAIQSAWQVIPERK